MGGGYCDNCCGENCEKGNETTTVNLGGEGENCAEFCEICYEGWAIDNKPSQ